MAESIAPEPPEPRETRRARDAEPPSVAVFDLSWARAHGIDAHRLDREELRRALKGRAHRSAGAD